MERQIPSEFAGFIRDAGVRAFDRLNGKSKELTAPVRSVLRAWSKLTQEQKDAMFDELIALAQAMTPPEEPKKRRTGKKAAKRNRKASS
ncbi:MAG TPA: hypothetical protein VF980_04615 [Thermoanaerobaculia bacterium]